MRKKVISIGVSEYKAGVIGKNDNIISTNYSGEVVNIHK
jgi:hypothetical protein